MSVLVATKFFRIRRSNKLFSKAGPVLEHELNKTHLQFEEALTTLRKFQDLFGLVTS